MKRSTMTTKEHTTNGFKAGAAEVGGRLLGAMLVHGVIHLVKKAQEKKNGSLGEDKTKTVRKNAASVTLDASNYELINRNLQKRLDAGVNSDDEFEILKQMAHNYRKIAELGGNN